MESFILWQQLIYLLRSLIKLEEPIQVSFGPHDWQLMGTHCTVSELPTQSCGPFQSVRSDPTRIRCSRLFAKFICKQARDFEICLPSNGCYIPLYLTGCASRLVATAVACATRSVFVRLTSLCTCQLLVFLYQDLTKLT